MPRTLASVVALFFALVLAAPGLAQRTRRTAPKPVDPTNAELVARIRDLEYRRAPVELLAEHASHTDAAVRRAAVIALARRGDHRAVGWLSRLFVDPDPVTRRWAIYGIGLCGHRSTIDALASVLRSSNATDRAWACFSIGLICQLDEELSKADSAFEDTDAGQKGKAARDALRAEACDALMPALEDSAATVRQRAAIAIGFTGHEPGVAALDAALTRLDAAEGDQADPALRWRLIYGLGRLGGERAVARLTREAALAQPSKWCHEFAAMYLARSPLPAAAAPLRKLVASPSWMVAAPAARGLAGQAGAATTRALKGALRHSAWQVRQEAARALGKLRVAGAAAALEHALGDRSRSVRAAAAGALVAIEPARAAVLLTGRADPAQARAAAAALGAHVSGEDADGGLVQLAATAVANAPMRVRAALVGALRAPEAGRVHSMLVLALSVDDVAVRAAALGGLEKSKHHAPIERLVAAYEASAAAQMASLRPDLLKLLGKHPMAKDNAEVRGLLKDALDAPTFAEREAAAKALTELTGTKRTPRPETRGAHQRWDTPIARKPVILLQTSKGDIELELYPAAAPVHVRTILDLVERGFYDGKTFHRVVNAFVIQGGAPRPDGWGEAGFELRDEINQIPYSAGTLGMPKAGKDTGSCQLFITHLPTPHLDGRYTVFGRVRRGMAAIDRIEVDDVIVRAVRIE